MSRSREQHQAYIRGLLEEREKLVSRSKKNPDLWDRVEQIDAQLGEVAKDAKLPQKRAEKRPAAAEATER